MPSYGDIVHRLEKEINELRLAPFDFTLAGICQIEYLVAEENKDFKAGEGKPIRIKEGENPVHSSEERILCQRI